ncbi:MAG: hypothetical protein AB8H03_11170 [Saprospiraceae bacterium]
MNQFVEILNFELLHDYFINGKCNQIQIIPDVDTQQWISKSGMKFFQKENIGRLMIPDQFNLQEVLDETPDFELQFDGISSNPEFINFTKFPIDKLGRIVFKNESATNNVNGSIELSNEFQADSNFGNKIVSIQIKLSNLISNKTDWPNNYKVQLNSRKTVWKYYLIDGSNKNMIFKLEGEGNELFSGPTSVELPNNSAAQLFDSGTNLIPFKEAGTMNLSLRGISAEKINDDGQIILNHLPNANPGSLQSSIANGKQELYSAIYVYI